MPPDPTRERRPMGRTGATDNRFLTNPTSSTRNRTRRVSHPGATAVVDTCVDQLDQLAGLGADAVLHGDRLDLVDVVAAVDRIGQRLGAAVAVLDLREPRP